MTDPTPAHDGGTPALVPHRTVATWPAASFVENIAIDPAGRIFVTLHPVGEIHVIGEDGVPRPFAKLPVPVAGLAFDRAGTLWVSAGTPGTAPGSIWRVAPDGSATHWLDIPDALFLNGITPFGTGRLLVAESILGRVLAIDTETPSASVWLEDDRLRPVPGAQVPGANGVKLFGGALTVSNTSTLQVWRVAVDGAGRPGAIRLVADHLRADDFAFDVQGNLYLTTHFAGSLVRLATDGSRTTLAGPAQGMANATACAFGRGPGDTGALYVTTEGLFPFDGAPVEPKLVRLDIGLPGHDLLAVPG